ncbi:MAG: HAD family phosphatase [Clostridia bacterium]|nr:HAD family phosphatase [Clostridia bacterium]MBR1607350.1 HAD family phosphatase [Clostridia bacterium]
MTRDKSIIFLDIDGTLSWYGAPPCEADIAALRRARAAGHIVLINTGRSRGILPPAFVGADYLDGYLCGCGTTLILNGRVVFDDALSRPLLRDISAFFLNAPGRCCLFEAWEDAYLIQCQTDFNPWPSAPIIHRADDFETLYPQAHITKLTVYGNITPAEYDLYRGRLEPVVQTSGQWYEAILPGRGKGEGIRRACDMLGVSIQNTIAIGDSDNDLDMFAAAGAAVAMEEASASALAAAQYKTGRCGHGGVAQAVNALIFGEGRLSTP